MIILFIYLIIAINLTKPFNLSPKFHIIINDPSQQDGSYFGYSVHLRSGIDGYVASIVVGAPKANSTYAEHKEIIESGVVYQCNVDEFMEINPSCSPLLLDPTGDVQGPSGTPIKHKKSYSMLGFAIDGQASRDGPFIACAPRWINQYYLQARNTILSNGMCYRIPNTKLSNHTAEQLIPLIAPNLQNFIVKKKKNYGYAFGQAGFSIHMPKEDGSELLLGAPGVFNWKGGMVRYRDIDLGIKTKSYDEMIITNSYYNRKILRDSLFGYALDSGIFISNFQTKQWYVSSAPRAKYKGRVYIFNLSENDGNDYDIDIKREFDGEQLGEYFGSSLCVTDVNGDGLDDVLIGAPRYSLDNELTAGDEGAVYVFLNLDNWHFQEQAKLQHAQKSRAQFGTCISSLQDLDFDGYNDVVIGAPYEDDGRGAIYVYLGTAKGLDPIPRQHIRAMYMDHNLLGFGISVSKGVDIDQNFYNDLAVGSYLSDNVVIFKSQPVMRFKSKIISSISEIRLNTTEFFVNVCISYNGRYLSKSVHILVNVQADSVYKRATFIEDNVIKNNLTRIVEIYIEHEVCLHLPLKLTDFSEDFAEPLEIRVQYFILEEMNKVKSIFCSSCPVTDPRENNVAIKFVPYSMGCGNDKYCTPNLKINAHFTNISGTFIFGTKKIIYLNISVTNSGETAFLTRLILTPLNELNFVQIPTFCNDPDQSITCELDNMLFGDERIIIFELDAININTNMDAIKLNLTVESFGEDKNDVDNNILIVLPLMSVAELKITSKSIPEQLSFKDKKGIMKNKVDPIAHEYVIQNLGPSPIGNSIVYFYFPILYDNFKIFNIMEPETLIESQLIKCNASWPGFSEDFIEYNDDDIIVDDEPTRIRIRRDTIDNDNLKVFQLNQSKIEFPINRTLFLNCSGLSQETVCMKITCELGLLQNSQSNSIIKLLIQPILENIDAVLQYKDILYVNVKVTLVPLIKLNVVNNGIVTTTLSTTLISSLPNENIAHFWIALAIALGLLFVRFIFSCLIKVGFFERTMKHKLELLKQGSLMRRWSLSRRNSTTRNMNDYRKSVVL